VVRENLQTLYAAAQEGFAGVALPPFVRQELEGYLDCGLLLRGFAHLENIVRFLKHLGEPTEPPPLAPARAPPYWQARELRHRPQAQTELFGA
jgi:hypothetical protein